jgi:hypothetical protein
MKWVSASTVIQLFNPYTLLHLNLSNCTQITDEVYAHVGLLVSSCLSLRTTSQRGALCARRVQAITKESRILETLIVSNNPNIMDPIKYGPDPRSHCVFVLEGGWLCETKNDLCVNTGMSVRACWPLTFDPPSSRMKRCARSPGTTRYQFKAQLARVYQFC